MAGAEEFFELAVDFERASARTAVTLFGVYETAGKDFRDSWRRNAEASSGSHAADYPKDITTEMRFAGTSILVETGPEDRGGAGHQGFLGRILEFGGEHSPAHLDGLRALGPADAKLTRLSDNAVRGVIP